jgi:hypothetical protein
MADRDAVWQAARKKQVAFRVQTDAAILGAGFVLAGGADIYPAPPATSRHHPKLAASFSPRTRNATCGSPHFARRKMISDRWQCISLFVIFTYFVVKSSPSHRCSSV